MARSLACLSCRKCTRSKEKLDPNSPDVMSTDPEDLQPEDADPRGSWSGRLDFLFTCIGLAVGLGNVWRFPFLCYRNGGGAFLIPYLIMLAVIGIPVFYLEVAMGQYARLGSISIWGFNPLLKGIGLAMVIVVWMVVAFYNVIVSHVLLYLFASLSVIGRTLPWVGCNNSWNTANCVEFHYNLDPSSPDSSKGGNFSDNATAFQLDMNISTSLWNAHNLYRNTSDNVTQGNVTRRSPTEEYYYNYVLEMSEGIDNLGSVNWKLCLCLLLAWLVVFGVLIKGVKSLGKVAFFTAIFPYVMLTVLFIRGITLPGASDGLLYYLKPDFTKLQKPRVWIDAGTQIFYSLSVGEGVQIAMASFNKFHNNCLKDTIIITLVNSATSLYAGLVVFSVLGFMALEKGVPISEVVTGGPGLVFVVYPEALSRMPLSWLWAVLFFFMMATLGFGSMFSLVEHVTSSIADELPATFRKPIYTVAFRSTVMFISFLFGIPMVCKGGVYLVNLVDYSISGFPIFIVGLIEVFVLQYSYGYDRLSDNINLMLGRRPSMYWCVTWKYLTPGVMSLIILLNMVYYQPPSLDGYIYPDWSVWLVVILAMVPLIQIPGVFIYRFCKLGGYQALLAASRPKETWAPDKLAQNKDLPRNGDLSQYRVQSPFWLDMLNKRVLNNNDSEPKDEEQRGSISELRLGAVSPAPQPDVCNPLGSYSLSRLDTLGCTENLLSENSADSTNKHDIP